MTTLSINLTDEQVRLLQETAARLGVAPEELVRLSIEDFLGRHDQQFQQAMEHTLKKNATLYRRLS